MKGTMNKARASAQSEGLEAADDVPVSPVRRGDLSAISSAFIENNILLKKFLTRFLFRKQDIEDVVQEAYLRAFNAERKAAVEIDQPKAYLFRVARNIALNELKRKSRHITDFLEECEAHTVNHTTPTLEEDLQAQQHLGLYCEAIASLSEQCRRLCLLRKSHGLKHREIAEHLELTVSSVEKHLRKGALACQAYIAEREDERSMAELGAVHQQPAASHSINREVK